MTSHRLSFMSWIMWLFPLSFFGFQFILRLFPGLILNEIIEKYSITATEFGLFASLYYLGYASMQIPMAIALDKWGTRKVLASCALICGLATWLFVSVPSWHTALISRFFIGAGSVVGFLGASKVISQWFPRQYYSKLVGLTFSFGLLGAIYGGRPVSQWIQQLGWEQVTQMLACVAIVIGLLSFLFLKEKKETVHSPMAVKDSLKTLFRNRSLWLLAIANLLMVGALEGFADVWGISFLMTTREISKMTASGITSYIFIGMLFGGPVLAYLAEKWRADYLVTVLCGISMAMLMVVVILFNSYLSEEMLKGLMLLLGMLCCYQVIVFAIGTRSVDSALIGMTVAFLNCINMLGGSFFHTLIGYSMDRLEQNTVLQSGMYSPESYSNALLIIPIASLVGSCLVMLSKADTQRKLALKIA